MSLDLDKRYIISRVIFLLFLYLMWLSFIRFYSSFPHIDLSSMMVKICLNSKYIYESFAVLLIGNKFLYLTLKFIYFVLFAFTFFMVGIYFFREREVFDKILLSLGLSVLIVSIIYSVFEVPPPRIVYNINLVNFREGILNFFTHSNFSFPSMHVLFTSLFAFYFLRYSRSFILRLYSIFLIVIYPVVIYVLATHWFVDFIPSYIISYLSFRLAQIRSLFEKFQNKILKKFEDLFDYLYSFYSSFSNKLNPFY